MNENQQELLNFIYQHNLSADEAARYVRDLDVSSEDKQAVLQDYQQRQEKQIQREEENRKKELAAKHEATQKKIDNIVPNLKAATQSLDQAREAYEEVGWFGNIIQEARTGFTEPGAYGQYLDQVKQTADIYRESRALLEQAGRGNLAKSLKMPSYGAWGGIVDNTTLNAGELLYGLKAQGADLLGFDETAREAVETSQAAGETKYAIKEMEGFAQQFSDLTFANAIPSIGAFMGEQIPMLALLSGAGIAAGPLASASGATSMLGRAAILGKNTLKLATTAPSLANMALASGRTFADIYDDPNISSLQKHAHASLTGVIEGTGDMVLGAIAGVVPVGNILKGSAITSKFGKIVGRNALTRSSAKLVGASSAESFQELSQEYATTLSEESILGREISDAERITRLKEAALGGFVMGGAFRVATAPSRIAQNIRMMADRPGDRTHIEATETFKEIRAQIEKSMGEDVTEAELKSIEGQLQELQQKERKRVASRQKLYRALRRRNPKGYDRLLQIDELINRKLAQSETFESERAKKVAKESIDALIEERNSITAEFEGQDNTLTPVERVEDALEDLNQGLAETQSDLDSVADMEPESEGDLKVLHFLQQRLSAMKTRKAKLQKALGDVQGAVTANDADAIAQAMADLDAVLSESLPSESKTTTEQLTDDDIQDVTEAQKTDSETQTQKETEEEGETKLDYEQTDKKGRKFTYFKKSKTKDGVTTTTFSFNRSDKSPDSRGTARTVPVEFALGDKFEIDQDDVPEGTKVLGVKEVRVGEDGKAAATVTFETETGGRFEGEVLLAPVQQSADTETQSQVTEEAPKPKKKKASKSRGAIVVNASRGLSESDMAFLPTHLIKLIQNMLDTGVETEIIVHDSREDMLAAHPQGATDSLAFFLPHKNQIHVHKDVNPSDLKHEFAHAMFHKLLEDDVFRKRLYNEIAEKWDREYMDKVKAEYEARYGPKLVEMLGQEAGTARAVRLAEEEAIVKWLEKYGNEDGVNMLKKRGIYQQVVDFFNNLFRKKYGRFAEKYTISNETDFVGVLEAFAAGVEVGSAVEVKTIQETEGQTALDSVSKAYPDMGGKEVTYSIKTPNKWGIVGNIRTSTKTFKDYWHFRNFWASMTGNGKHNWIDNIYYTDDNGQRKNVNIPSPKRDRNGDVIDMEPKIYNWNQKEVYSHRGYWRNIGDIRTQRNIINSQIKDFERQNQPVPESLTQRRDEINEAIRELAELYDNKDPFLSKYDAIKDRIMGGMSTRADGSMYNPEPLPGKDGPDFIKNVRPDNEAQFGDQVVSDFALDSTAETTGMELDHGDGVEVRGRQPEHNGLPSSALQFDKSDGTSGSSATSQPRQVTSHASHKFAADMKKDILMTARKYLKQNPELDIDTLTYLVYFSLQADSTLSNPRALDIIVEQFKSLNEDQKAFFLEAFDKRIEEILSSRQKTKKGALNNPESIKAFLKGVEKVYNGTDPTDLERRLSFSEMNKSFYIDENGSKIEFAYPVFNNLGDDAFIDLINAMQKHGNLVDDPSIARNSIFISALFADDVAREFGKSHSDIKDELTADNFKAVQTADIVSYREVYFDVKKNPSTGELELASGLEIVEDPDVPFSWILVSDKGARYYGLPNAIPYPEIAKDAVFEKTSKSKLAGMTMGEAYEYLRDLESGEDRSVEVKVLPSKLKKDKGRLMTVSQAVELRDVLKSRLEEDIDVSERTLVNDEINRIEDALDKADEARKKNITSTKSAIARKQQGGVSFIAMESVSLDFEPDQEVAMDSVNNNSWAPRDRSSLQQQIDWMRLKFQDKFAPIMMMQEDIEAARGSRVEGDQNFKRAEELMYGKAHNDLEKLEDVVEELKQSLKDGGISAGDLTDFMYARHAPERNAMLKSRDGVDNGSGMTDQEAADVLAMFSQEQTAALEKAAAIVDRISQDTRDTMRKFGLESDARIDSFEDMFDHYVPLGGVATDSQDVDNYPYPTGGLGFHVKGAATKKAKGRKTLAQNVVAQVIQQNAAVKIKARKNEALQSLFNLVAKNPNTKLWNTSDNIPVNDADRAVGVRINGEQKFIIFKDSSLAKNLKGMGTQKLDALSRLMAAPANFLRVAFTTRNPEFIISNFSRDILSAIPNALAEADLDDGSIGGKHSVARKIIQRVPSTLKALLKSDVMGKDLDPIMAKYLSEFKEDGGQTGWGFVKPLQQIAAELDAETDEGNKAKKAIKWMEKNSLQHIENMNDAFENSIRLSAYIEAREAGVSREDAAQLAKNITVNFNKSGEYGAVANAYYLFFNASIQGSARIVRSLGKMKTVQNMDGTFSKQLSTPQKIVIGLALTSGLLAMLNMAMSDEDEDGELFYNKIPDYEKERNLIMMYDGKNYIKIPLPYGYNLFSNFGTALAETMAGERDADDAMWFVANSAFSSFSPVSFGQSDNFAKYIAKGAAPTVFKPLIEMAVNETYFGSKVYQEQFPVGAKRPESELAFRSPKVIKGMFQWLNEATGGSEMVSGAVDINPDLFWYPFEYYIGGLGQFGMRTSTALYSIEEMIRTGEKPELQANDIPFLRKVYGEPSKYYDYDLYDKNKSEVLQLYKERKAADVKTVERYNGIVKLDKKIKLVEKKLKALRKERRAAQDLPYIQRVNKTAVLQEQERLLIMEYNALHEKLRGEN